MNEQAAWLEESFIQSSLINATCFTFAFSVKCCLVLILICVEFDHWRQSWTHYLTPVQQCCILQAFSNRSFSCCKICTCGTRLVRFAIYCCVLYYIQKVWHSLKSDFIENSFCSSQHEQRFIGDLCLTRYACQILTCNVLKKMIHPCGHGCFSVTTFRCAHCFDQNEEFSQRRLPQKRSLLGHATGRGKKKNLQRKLTHLKNVW